MKESIKKRIEAVRRGEVPEGYKRTDSGVMPEEWPNSTIGKIIAFHSEKSTINNQYPVLTSARSGLALQTEYFEDQVTREENAGYNVIPRGYVTYRSRSDDGRFTFNQNQIVEKGIVSCFYPVFRIIEDLADPTFVLSYLNNYLGRQIVKEIVGTSQLVLSEKKLSALRLPCPPLAEQKKISEILATCDRVIELKRQLLEEKRRQKKWLMQKLLDPNAGVNQPECSGVKWITRCIKELGTVITGSTPDKSCDEFWGGDFPWITSQDFTGKYIGIAEVHVTDAGKKKCRVLPAGAVLVTCIASIGLNAIAKVECATNQQINAVICNGICSEEMLYYIIEYNRGTLERIAGKTAVPIISKDQFEKIKVTIPESRSEQDKITKVLSAADSEIQLLQNELEIWQQKKKALMQLLLTGLVRVNA